VFKKPSPQSEQESDSERRTSSGNLPVMNNSSISKPREVIMAEQKCSMCDWEIKDGGVKVTVGGKELTVCCDDCAKDAIAKHNNAAAA
jgi:hypothetical protein